MANDATSTRAPEPTERRTGAWRGLLVWLRAHPIVCLFLLTPGLVEYLSGSSSFTSLVLNPAWFFLALSINAAMYTSGALLVREAMIRWHKGWPTAFALGSAYAIMEEGIADQTIFNPHNSPMGAAGTYGHFLGVNWLWAPDVLFIHILMSLAIPILFLQYALPETRGKSLLTMRGVWTAVVVIALDTAFLAAIVATSAHNWYGFPMLAAAVVAIGGFIAVGYVLPNDLFRPTPGRPSRGPGTFFVLGAVTYPLMVLTASLTMGFHLPPVLGFVALLGLLALAYYAFIRSIGTFSHERHVIAFGSGLLVIGFVLGIVTEWYLPIVLIADVAVLVFLRWLYRSAPSAGAPELASPGVAPAHVAS